MDDYEFAMLENERDVETGNKLLAGNGGKKGPKKGRDLYDAFGASDDEDAVFSSDEEEHHKHDSEEGEESDEEESSGSYQDVPSEKEGDSKNSGRGRLIGRTV